ncbi:cytochrome P450 [Dendrothele bispora CBS 962.96]|uniref:Cytochrome P450 n=1 Tax=Dendrothele bispora (strain CBS 962.96) TaxID=1314807 RepID=A0A4S8L7X0_DENBC|nr:cytochrome P450 [Dendrothele bispora CBS 962.96]
MPSLGVLLPVLLSSIWFLRRFVYSTEKKHESRDWKLPPVVELSETDIYQHPQEAYQAAIEKYGPVVGVVRKNQLEYIIDHTLTAQVLTNDAMFSFEHATLRMLNLSVLLSLPRSFAKELDTIVQEDITANMDNIIETLVPIFQRHAQSLKLSRSKSDPIAVDLESVVHLMMAESMLTLIFGKRHATPENIHAVENVAADIATLTGIFQNMGYFSRNFPSLWRRFIWVKITILSIPYYFRIGSIAFRGLGAEESNESDSILDKCAKRYKAKNQGSVPFLDKIWIIVVLLGLIFASVHQTAIVIVWVLFELATRPQFLEAFRKEVQESTNSDGDLCLTYASLKKAEQLDSFIREVMRTKGDTLLTTRLTTKDVPLAGYIIPKGSFVAPLATLSHMNKEYHGDNAKEFVGGRWVGQGKPAVMVSNSYFPFGLGRWACPGRFLAVAEIKMAVLFLITHATPRLKDNAYRIRDPLNITSVAPEGDLYLESLKD